MATYKNVERYGTTNLGVRTPDPPKRRMNGKRKCQFCKVTFLSQHVYNDHVNTCDETPKTKRRVK